MGGRAETRLCIHRRRRAQVAWTRPRKYTFHSRAARDYNPTVHFDLNFWAAVLSSQDSERFALESKESWPGPTPLIELHAQPPTISVLEPISGADTIAEDGFDDLDAEIAELARNAEEEEEPEAEENDNGD